MFSLFELFWFSCSSAAFKHRVNGGRSQICTGLTCQLSVAYRSSLNGWRPEGGSRAKAMNVALAVKAWPSRNVAMGRAIPARKVGPGTIESCKRQMARMSPLHGGLRCAASLPVALLIRSPKCGPKSGFVCLFVILAPSH